MKDDRAVEPLIGAVNFRAEQQPLDAEKLRIEAVSLSVRSEMCKQYNPS